MLKVVETYNSKGELITDEYKVVLPELEEFLTEVCQKLENISTNKNDD